MEEFVTDLPAIEQQQGPRLPKRVRTTKSISPALYRSLALAARNKAKEQKTAADRRIYLIIATELDRLRKTSRRKNLSVWRRCGARRISADPINVE